ncbi:taste receptor type 2 member 7-like [Hyla sarda]|uniref:taste receptor type 2 member 7-like n=1 Tax=Hyla sarda TaxID=327740 RepID=UPI0024C3233F|nr:taste receptor type 2 member 7-like [Hyla sarda]
MVLYLDVLFPELIALIAGLVIHSFIIVINVTDWLNGRSVTPVDWVVTSLGISRMCTQCAATMYMLLSSLFLKKLYAIQVILDVIDIFFAYTNIWLTSLLSIVFCLKISNLRTRLFLYLRRMIDQRTVHFIVGSVPLSLLNCLYPLLVAITEINKHETFNTTMDNLLTDCAYINIFYSHIIGSIIPILFCPISSILLFTSLYRHITKMKMSGNLSINLETYYSAMTFVFFTFLYNSSYFTVHFVSFFFYFIHCLTLPWLYIALDFLPVLHSSYLIYRISKLRSHMSKVLQNVIDLFFQKKDPEPREDIEMVA